MGIEFRPRIEIVNGLRVGYRMCGSGPILALFAGFGQSSAWWCHFVDTYAEHFTVIAPDFKGFGCSDKPASGYLISDQAALMAALLSELGVGRASIVGLSFGGAVALKMAALFPPLVERLVVVSTPFLGGRQVNRSNMNTVPLALRLLRNPVTARLMVALRNKLTTEMLFREMGYPAQSVKLPREAVEEIVRDAYTNTWESLHGSAIALMQEDMTSMLCGISAPTLIVHGRMDKMVLLQHAEALHRAIPSSRLAIIEDAGHGVMLHKKAAFEDLALAFLCKERVG